jgi:hypothetical protein
MEHEGVDLGTLFQSYQDPRDLTKELRMSTTERNRRAEIMYLPIEMHELTLNLLMRRHPTCQYLTIPDDNEVILPVSSDTR